MPTPPPVPPNWDFTSNPTPPPVPVPPPLPKELLPGEEAAPSGGMPQAPLDIELPLPTGFAILDTETGGLSAKVNPLLSVALVVADAERREVDGFALRVSPPEGTMLEIPIPDHIGKTRYEVKKREVQYYLDVFSGEKYTEPGDRFVITSQAAEINGYVSIHPNGMEYDFGPMEVWNSRLPVEKAEETYVRFLAQFFTHKPIPVAHNASFDKRFIDNHMPLLSQNMMDTWFCTMKAFKKWKKANGYGTGRGACTLETACKHAEYELDNAHEALADTRGCLAVLRFLRDAGFQSIS